MARTRHTPGPPLWADEGSVDWGTDDRATVTRRFHRDSPYAGWVASATFSTEGGLPIVAEFTIAPAGRRVPRGGLTNAAKDAVRLADLYSVLAKVQRKHPEFAAQALSVTHLPTKHDEHRRGRRGFPDEHYVTWASRYEQLVNDPARGRKRAVYRELAHRYPERGRPMELREREIRRAVYEARDRGLLLGGHQGRLGGVLSEAAVKLLDQIKEEHG